MILRGLTFALVGLTLGTASAIAHSQACHAINRSRDTRAWCDYQVIIWQDQTPLRLAGLARLGVTAGRVFGVRGAVDPTKIPQEVAAFRALNLRWYVENIATDFYAAYHRWHPDRSVTWLFDQAKSLYRRDPADQTAFIRTPSLSDPDWMRRIVVRLEQHARAFKAYRPLYYSLADEAGIADLAAAWDFDQAPASLAAMRVWLKRRYGSLAALNREWGSRFTRWNAVMPMSTDAALRQPDENFSAWADFKAWMDVAFARAVRVGTDAVHAADPQARAALEGAQPPGWGGYNYSHLATAVDVLELYNADNNVELVRSLAPNVITLSTSSLAGPEQIHAIWHELLLGERGLILWDANNAFVDDDGRPTQRGRALAALVDKLRSGVAAQLIASTPVTDPVAILYSPASFRTQWLLDRRADGRSWVDRGSETEDIDKDQVRIATQRAAAMLAHLGVQPRWLTDTMIEKGILGASHIRVLVLPHTIALSPAEVHIIRDFVRKGGVVLADTAPGLFDAHSRRIGEAPLANLTGAEGPIILMSELREGAQPDDAAPLARMRQILEKARVTPRFTLSTPEGALATNIDTRIFRNGNATIIGLQRDWNAGGSSANQNVVLGFMTEVYAYDLRHPGPPQHAAKITLTLDPIEPAVIAVLQSPLPRLEVMGPSQARLGDTAYLTIARSRSTSAGARIAHLEVIAPDGRVATGDSANLAVRGQYVTWRMPLKLTDAVGNWTIRMVDVLGSTKTERKLAVQAPISLSSR